jgi:hypothetical protein
MLTSPGGGLLVISVNPLLALLSLAVIAVALHGLREDSAGELVLAGLLGLLFFPLFFIGTLLSATSLLVLWLGDRIPGARGRRG